MRRSCFAGMLIAAAVAACGSNDSTSGPSQPVPPPPPPPNGSSAVVVTDNAFGPASLNISAGQTVVWTNTGAATHTVTANDGSFNSGAIAARTPGYAGGTYSHVFSAQGTYAYHCTLHAGMTGTVVVGPMSIP